VGEIGRLPELGFGGRHVDAQVRSQPVPHLVLSPTEGCDCIPEAAFVRRVVVRLLAPVTRLVSVIVSWGKSIVECALRGCRRV
jgi:hypothetical protein